jgi:hypothetical protein
MKGFQWTLEEKLCMERTSGRNEKREDPERSRRDAKNGTTQEPGCSESSAESCSCREAKSRAASLTHARIRKVTRDQPRLPLGPSDFPHLPA